MTLLGLQCCFDMTAYDMRFCICSLDLNYITPSKQTYQLLAHGNDLAA